MQLFRKTKIASAALDACAQSLRVQFEWHLRLLVCSCGRWSWTAGAFNVNRGAERACEWARWAYFHVLTPRAAGPTVDHINQPQEGGLDPRPAGLVQLYWIWPERGWYEEPESLCQAPTKPFSTVLFDVFASVSHSKTQSVLSSPVCVCVCVRKIARSAGG